MKVFLLILLTLSLLISCTTKKIDQGVYKRSEHVTDLLSSSLKAPWYLVEKQHTDLVLENKITKSLFLFSSACRSFEASSLNQLTSSLITGLTDIEIINREVLTHQSREAISMRFNASLDGVRRYMQTMTTLKNYCIYDYSLIATSSENREHDIEDFNHFINLIILN